MGGLASYRVNRLERIAVTSLASVFFARYIVLSEDVVAKVIKYKGRTPEDLIKCARD